MKKQMLFFIKMNHKYREHCLKSRRNITIKSSKLARKTVQQANLTDVLTRLWVKSDPIV